EREELREAMDQLIYSVSHDLNAPLRQMRQLTEFILDDWQREKIDKIPSMLDLLRRRATRAEDMLNALLDLSRVGRVVHELSGPTLESTRAMELAMLAPAPSVEVRLPDQFPGEIFQPGSFVHVLVIGIKNALVHGGRSLGHIN